MTRVRSAYHRDEHVICREHESPFLLVVGRIEHVRGGSTIELTDLLLNKPVYIGEPVLAANTVVVPKRVALSVVRHYKEHKEHTGGARTYAHALVQASSRPAPVVVSPPVAALNATAPAQLPLPVPVLPSVNQVMASVGQLSMEDQRELLRHLFASVLEKAFKKPV